MSQDPGSRVVEGERWELPGGPWFVVEYITGTGIVFGTADNGSNVTVGVVWLQEHGIRIAMEQTK